MRVSEARDYLAQATGASDDVLDTLVRLIAAMRIPFVLYSISSAKRMCVSVSPMFLPKRV